MFECPDCDARGCPECGGRGDYEVGVPIEEYVTHDVWQVIQYAKLYEKGLPPVAGGALDQAAVFVDACLFIWQEQAYWRNKLGLFHW